MTVLLVAFREFAGFSLAGQRSHCGVEHRKRASHTV